MSLKFSTPNQKLQLDAALSTAADRFNYLRNNIAGSNPTFWISATPHNPDCFLPVSATTLTELSLAVRRLFTAYPNLAFTVKLYYSRFENNKYTTENIPVALLKIVKNGRYSIIKNCLK